MRWKEAIVMPAAVIAVGMFWITWEAKQKKSEQEASFQVPDSDDPQVYLDFMRELHAELPFMRPESWHYQRTYASMLEAKERLRKLVPEDERLPPFATLCDIYYRVGSSVSSGAFAPDEVQAVLNDFETYMSRKDAMPIHKQDNAMLSVTLDYILLLMENQERSKGEALAYASRLEVSFDSFDDLALRDSAKKTLIGFRKRMGLLGEPYRLAGETLAEGTLDTNEFLGKVVFIEFWSTTCGPCVSELPKLLSIHGAHQSDLAIVGVSRDQSKRKLNRFADDREIPWPQLWINREVGNSELFETLGINAVPYSMVLDRTGCVIALNVRADELEKSLVDWLK